MNNKRTTIYIDGFNLYYGCLKRTSYKWLDLKALFINL
ncbi:TPA: NYN domain-containing protein, partial [Legionella pneumophila]